MLLELRIRKQQRLERALYLDESLAHVLRTADLLVGHAYAPFTVSSLFRLTTGKDRTGSIRPQGYVVVHRLDAFEVRVLLEPPSSNMQRYTSAGRRPNNTI